MTVDQRKTVIVQPGRRPDERIDDDQQEEIRDRIDSPVKIDCLTGPALNPKDPRTHEERRESISAIWRGMAPAERRHP